MISSQYNDLLELKIQAQNQRIKELEAHINRMEVFIKATVERVEDTPDNHWIYPTIQTLNRVMRNKPEINLKEMSEDARRYHWIRENIQEEVYQRADQYSALKTKYVLPQLTAYADFCGQIPFDDAVDISRDNSLDK